MGLILSLETATTNCSVALGKDGKQVALTENNSDGYSHAEKLHLFIKETMSAAGLSLTELNAIAVSKGPGSYTGLRIGVSAAKGLCFSLNIPLIAVDTLETIALKATEKKQDFIVPMLDARRMEVYTAVFDKSCNKLTPTEAKILDAESYKEYLDKGSVLFIGNAVGKFEAICSHKNANFSKALPSAKEIIGIAETKYKKNDTVDVAYFEPYYLKDFIGHK